MKSTEKTRVTKQFSEITAPGYGKKTQNCQFLEKLRKVSFLTKQPFFTRLLFFKHHHNWVVSSSDLYPLVCLKKGFKNICLKPKIDRTCASSLWKTDTIVFVELNKPPSPLSPPPPPLLPKCV